MESDLEKKLSSKIATLSAKDKEAVLEYVESRIARGTEKEGARPIWEVIAEISEEIPIEEWEKLPSDGSVNHDHYLYGAPKRY
jgi:hypothetical protein